MDVSKYSVVNVVNPNYDEMDFVQITNKEMAKVENVNVSYNNCLSYYITRLMHNIFLY